MKEYLRMRIVSPGRSWWLWVLGTLMGLSAGVMPKHHCPQGQYQVEQGSWCCRLCSPGTYLVEDCDGDGKDSHCKSCTPGFSFTPDHHAQRQCESCRICNDGLSIQSCNITTNSKCACPKGQQCRDKECTNCDPQSTYLLSTRQYPLRSISQHPTSVHEHPANASSANISERTSTGIPTIPAGNPSGRTLNKMTSINILILCVSILAFLIVGTWLIWKQRHHGLKKEQATKEPIKLCLTGFRGDPGPSSPKQEEGSTVPIQEDYRKPDPASYP